MSDVTPIQTKPTWFAWSSLALGIVGWFASFQLLTEYIKTLTEPNYVPNCNLSVIVTCGPNMDSWQGSVLGFSNTIIGVAAFMAPIIVGVAVLAGARFTQWFWVVYRIGLLGGLIFISWLAYQSIFRLGTLCPWCMVVWLVMIPLFWLTLTQPEAAGMVSTSDRTRQRARAIRTWVWVGIAVYYVVIAALAQFQLDWFAEFTR